MQLAHLKLAPQVNGKHLSALFRKPITKLLNLVRNNQGMFMLISIVISLVGAALKNSSATMGCTLIIFGCIMAWGTVLASINTET